MRKSTRYALGSFGLLLVLQVCVIGGYRYWWLDQSVFGAFGLVDTNNKVAAAMATMQGFQSVIADGPMEVSITRQASYSVRLIPSPGRDKVIGARIRTIADRGVTILVLQARRDIGNSEPVPQVEIGTPVLKGANVIGFRRVRVEGFDQRLGVAVYDGKEVVLVNNVAGIDLRVGGVQQLAWDDVTAANSKLQQWGGSKPKISLLPQETR